MKSKASCFAALWTVRRCLPLAAYKSLIISLVLSQLDYGNATLSGLPDYQFRRLQSVINAAAFGPRNISLDETALVECSQLSRLQGCDVGLALSP